MRKRKFIILMCVAASTICACSKEQSTSSAESGTEAVVTEEMSGTTRESETQEVQEAFPESYTGGTETVKFDCTLEVSDNFNINEFYLPEITGKQYLDSDAVYSQFIEGQDVSETYSSDSDKENVPGDDMYVLADGTSVTISGVDGFIYSTPSLSIYDAVMRSSEKGASKEDFSFDTGDNCVEKIKESLKGIGYPIDEFNFDWFSLSGEEHKELEQEAAENGSISQDEVHEDWTDKNSYEIYAWQMYEGLPVLSEWFTLTMSRALESYQKAQVQAVYTADGCISLMANIPYKVEKTEELAKFLTFDEIAGAVETRYDNLMTDSVYTINRAKLMLRVYYNEEQEYEIEPVWYFESTDTDGNLEILMFNALTGEEIFLND